jgi:hypothetical protein
MKTIAIALFAACAALAQQPTDRVTFDEVLEVDELLRRGDTAAKERSWDKAIDSWQRILEKHPDAVVQGEAGLWIPASTVCRRRVAALPPDAIALYAERFAGAAKQLLRSGDPASVAQAATRYFCTDAGADAMERLGHMHADAGALEMALRCFEEVASRHPKREARPAMLARLGLLYARFGMAEELRALLASHGGLEVRARGQVATIAQMLQGRQPPAPPERGPVAVLPDMSLAPLPDTPPVPKGVKWRLTISTREADADANERRRVWVPNGGEVTVKLQTYPSTRDGALFVNVGRTVLALDVATGAVRWRGFGMAQELAGVPGDLKLPPQFGAGMPAEFWLHRWFAVEAEGVVYANVWLGDKRCRLTAYNASTGKAVWHERGGIAEEFDVSGMPVVWRDRVYVGAVDKESPDQTHVLAFDRGSGRLLWSRFLAECTVQNAFWGAANVRPACSPMVAAGAGGVYACSNNGALVCLGHDGQMIWGIKYRKPNVANTWWMAAPQDETWDLNPLLFIGDHLLFFAVDGTHCCRIEARTGKGFLGDSDPLKAMQVVAREQCRHLLALEGDVGTLAGGECKLYDLRAGKMERGTWHELPKWARYSGRGMVTKDRIFVPARAAGKPVLYSFNRRFGDRQQLEWPSKTPPGTLMLSGKTILSVSPYEVVALSEDAPKEAPEEAPEDENGDGEPDEGGGMEREEETEEEPQPR